MAITGRAADPRSQATSQMHRIAFALAAPVMSRDSHFNGLTDRTPTRSAIHIEDLRNRNLVNAIFTRCSGPWRWDWPPSCFSTAIYLMVDTSLPSERWRVPLSILQSVKQPRWASLFISRKLISGRNGPRAAAVSEVSCRLRGHHL